MIWLYTENHSANLDSTYSIYWIDEEQISRDLPNDGTTPTPHPKKFLTQYYQENNQALDDKDTDAYPSTPLLDKFKAWNRVCLESR